MKTGHKIMTRKFTKNIPYVIKVSLCENCQRQSDRAFIGLSICAKMIGGGRFLLCENLADTDPPPSKTPIFNLLSLVAPQP